MRAIMIYVTIADIFILTLLLALYMQYNDLIAHQNGLQSNFERLEKIVVRECMFNLVSDNPATLDNLDLRQCFDMTITPGIPMEYKHE